MELLSNHILRSQYQPRGTCYNSNIKLLFHQLSLILTLQQLSKYSSFTLLASFGYVILDFLWVSENKEEISMLGQKVNQGGTCEEIHDFLIQLTSLELIHLKSFFMTTFYVFQNQSYSSGEKHIRIAISEKFVLR